VPADGGAFEGAGHHISVDELPTIDSAVVQATK
jgi:hypothetical protein